MTTSGRCSELHHPDVLEDELQGRQARNLPDVERRRNLIDVEPREPQAAELAQEVEELARGEPARRGNATPAPDRPTQRAPRDRAGERVPAEPRAAFVRQSPAGPRMR